MKKLIFLITCLLSNIIQSSQFNDVNNSVVLVIDEEDGSSCQSDNEKTMKNESTSKDQVNDIVNELNQVDYIVGQLKGFHRQAYYIELKKGNYHFCAYYGEIEQSIKTIHNKMIRELKNNPLTMLDPIAWNRVLSGICQSKLILHSIFDRDQNRVRHKNENGQDKSCLILNSEHLEILNNIQKELLNMTCTILNHGVFLLKKHQNSFDRFLTPYITLVIEGENAKYVPKYLLPEYCLQSGKILVSHAKE